MRTHHLVVVALLVVAGACGRSDAVNPAGPSSSKATVTALAITPATDLIKLKGAESFNATATLSNGSTSSVQATWGSDNASVATIDTGGRATAVSSGQATIFADYQGQRATRLLRVVPDYQGRWSGDFRVAGCGETGDWLGVCADAYPTGSLFPLDLSATQDRDAITGTTDFGDRQPGPVSGSIRMSGHLGVSGTYSMTIEGWPVEITVSDWETLTTDNDRMTGRFRLTMRAAGIQGSIYTDGELRVVAKTSSTPLVGVPDAAQGIALSATRALRK